MYTVKNSAEFIADIRAIDERLKNIRISSIEIEREKTKIRYNFICDQAVDEQLQEKILREAEKITLPAFSLVEISVKKIVSNDELINNEIFKYLNEKYPSVSIFLKPTDVISTVVGNVVKYVLRLTKDGSEYVLKNGAITKLNEFLSKRFCSDFAGSTEIKEADESISLLSEEVYADELQKIEHRTIKVKDVIVIDDANMGDLALYIEDAVSGEVTVSGVITEITERETKNGKPFLIIHLDDTTGKTSGVYFSKKSTYHKIKELVVGDAIIVRGNMGEYNGRRSFTFDKINRCTFPSDFVKKDKYKKTAPREYKNIFPSEASVIKVKSVFDAEEVLPAELTDTEYVVFDLETTGLDLMSNGITEIGAVKIVNGKIKEQFTTLVKPDYRISEENFEITGISEEMVKDAPKISAVIPDFMKFIDGAVLVAQNAEFDLKFIKRFAGAEEYEVKNKVMDTMELARTYLPQLRRHDLATIAEHFGIVFHHHRALSDAYCTAEAFIELMKIKNKA
ncbi:MAG: 3'-5' exoribonuclease [Clostridia bacterium]|nr:3'-5' exoribonuclease [Clostridia bacterium]